MGLLYSHSHSLLLIYKGCVDMTSTESWVDISEVAAHLQVAKESVYRWVDSKGFPAHRVGRLLRFRLSEVDEWVKTSGDRDSRNHSTSEVKRARRSGGVNWNV